jgi:transcriptional regulator with XRE-family HTH domain
MNKALKLIRVFHRVKQIDLAKELDISRSYLCEIERGDKTISVELLERYSKRFNIPLSSLFFFSEQISEDDTKKRKSISTKALKMLEWVELRTRDQHEKV